MNDMFDNGTTVASQSALHHYDRAMDAHLHAWPGVLESIEGGEKIARYSFLGCAPHTIVRARNRIITGGGDDLVFWDTAAKIGVMDFVFAALISDFSSRRSKTTLFRPFHAASTNGVLPFEFLPFTLIEPFIKSLTLSMFPAAA